MPDLDKLLHASPYSDTEALIFHFTNYAGSVTLTFSADAAVLEAAKCTADEFLRLVSENIDKLEEYSREQVPFKFTLED
ncbi:unnamed protein product [Cyprideis torosa]|uniref:Uncharacterized protein n=1 Tax=Cyprideis torosa TaxID=163714 RepID=A0A7R8WL29_9CRUS|nr:unnamed protein product [Cyprideis torosa]CAG0897742.1 unnamed protein product [Cyprideis torosa]